MPRSSFSENPLLRVSRPVSACSRCRAAKVKRFKCDGKLPACTACEKAGRENECSSANDQFARGKERSYVAALELRIEKLERRLNYARSRKASVAQHELEPPPAQEPDRKDSLATIRAAIHRKAERKRENSDVNSLMSDFGFLSINATTRDFEPSMSNMTFARLVLAASSNNRLPDTQNWNAPSRQDGLSIVQYYMNNIYSLYPAFSETNFYTLLEQVYNQSDRSIKDSEYWLVFMVLAVGSVAQSQATNDAHYMNGVYFASRAMRHADKALTPGYVTQIQSLILLTQYSMLDPTHFDSWHLIGFTCRSVVDLGFHQDPPPEQMPDKAQLDTRRKLFYCVYSLDRSISMVQARAFSFTDASTNVAWPRPQSFSRRASITGQMLAGSEPAFLLFQLRWAQSHWYQILFQSDTVPIQDSDSFIWQMCQDMREWAEALPVSLPVGMRELFDLELRYSYVYCLMESERAPNMTDYRRMLVFEHTIAYLNRMYDIVQKGAPNAFYTSHDALRIFFMASKLVAVLNEAENLISAGVTISPPPVDPGKAPPPPLPIRPGGPAVNNLQRSLDSLERANQALATWGQRWQDSSSLQQALDMSTRDIVVRLRIRQQMRQTASPPQTVSPPAPREMRWVDVDVEAMMRGR
ncbi:putative Zn(2)-C6 fungal-type domain-containing protein [Seiridium cardinale]|uniref:Zn(2)-C6 fungal-type domain-containing protein n=1 Tax=Seiridium cardinale TaxID=138064 RepID=A0ABR2XCI6_9PEZI